MRESNPADLSRSGGVSGRAPAMLVALAAALITGFVVAPPTLAASSSGRDLADHRHLVEALHEAFVEYWRSGDRGFPPHLQAVVDYWFRYHLAKAVIATILLIVLVALGVVLWKAFLRAGGAGAGSRVTLASAGALVTMLSLFALTIVMANIQGIAAPFASLLPMLTGGPTDGQLADTLQQVRQRLTDSLNAGGRTTPALDVMIGAFAQYHVAMAAIAAMAALAFIGISASFWRRFSRTAPADRRAKHLMASFGTLSIVVTLIVILLAVANTTVAAAPAPALLALFEGGW